MQTSEFSLSAEDVALQALRGVHHHGGAGEGGLQLEDFMEAGVLRLPQLLFRHLHHKAHGGVGVVLLEVGDDGGNLLCAVHHGLQHVLLVGLP